MIQKYPKNLLIRISEEAPPGICLCGSFWNKKGNFCNQLHADQRTLLHFYLLMETIDHHAISLAFNVFSEYAHILIMKTLKTVGKKKSPPFIHRLWWHRERERLFKLCVT